MNQLILIVNTLGIPNDEFISLAHADRIKDFLRSLLPKQAVSLNDLLPKAHPKALRLLSKMLQWSPTDRVSVDAALQDLYLNLYHNPNDEPTCPAQLYFTHDEEKITDIDEMRKVIYDEIMTTLSQDTSKLMCDSRSSDMPMEPVCSSSPSLDTTDKNARRPRDVGRKSTRGRRGRGRPFSSTSRSRQPATSPMQSFLSELCTTQTPLDAKAILRAAILSGKRKQNVKVRGRRGRRKQCVSTPAQCHSRANVQLSDEDRSLLSRWQSMQQETLVQKEEVDESGDASTSIDSDCQLSSADSRLADRCLADAGAAELCWTPSVQLSSADISGCLQSKDSGHGAATLAVESTADSDSCNMTITDDDSSYTPGSGYGVGDDCLQLANFVADLNCELSSMDTSPDGQLFAIIFDD